MIDWVAFSWEAFATIFTGALAVLGAWTIADKQTKIQFLQYRLSETNIRIAVYEKRADCVSKMREIYSIWMRNARLTNEEWIEFRSLYYNAELIFSRDLSREIDEALDALFFSEHWMRRSRDYHLQGKADLAEQRMAESFEHDNKAFELMPNLLKKMKEEARLSDWE